MSGPRWDDESLEVDGDTGPQRRYRTLQSWYRETQLKLEPGLHGDRPVGSLLPARLGERATANFLTANVIRYVDERVPAVLAEGGTLDENRLRLNMLSSMPLCFNLFGELRAHPEAAARVLAAALELPIHRIDAIDCEWKPVGPHPLHDRTAMDARIVYRDADGARGLVAVETKYTEPFSREEYERSEYRRLTDDRSIFREGAADELLARPTNQAWRNLLLTIAVARAEGFVHHHMAIVALADDSGARAAHEGLTGQLVRPADWIRRGALEAIVKRAHAEPELESWAQAFWRRYLDPELPGLWKLTQAAMEG